MSISVSPSIRLRSVLGTGLLVSTALFSPAAHADLSFTFDYSGNTAGVGFLDPTFGSARQTAMTTAGTLFSGLFGSYFVGTTVLDFSVTSSFDPGGSTLASAGSQQTGALGFGNGEVIRQKIQTGNDLNGGAADGMVDVNWGYNWQIDPNTPAVASGPSASFDFYAAVFHEFTHALGFGSNINAAGATSTPGSFTKWDQFLTNQAGDSIVDPTATFVNLAAYSDAQTNGGRFAGANAIAAYGGPVPLVVNPDISHLNTDAFSPPTVPGPYMMVPTRDFGPQEARAWSATEVGILTDLGYTVTAVPEPETYALMIAGLGVLAFVARRRKQA
jgi:hypothetical protein